MDPQLRYGDQKRLRDILDIDISGRSLMKSGQGVFFRSRFLLYQVTYTRTPGSVEAEGIVPLEPLAET